MVIMEETCEECGSNILKYIYYNPVSRDVRIVFCPVCDKEAIERDGWVIDEDLNDFISLEGEDCEYTMCGSEPYCSECVFNGCDI
jgi:hypothetical protein